MQSDDQPVNDPPDPSDVDEANEGMICPHCMRSIAEDTHFCPHCSGPVTSIAAMDPMGQVLTYGYGMGKAVDKPTKPIILWGMWLLLGPEALIIVVGIGPMVLRIFDHEVGWAIQLGLVTLGLAGLGALYCWMLYRMTKNYLRLKRIRLIESAICLKCGYDLRGSARSGQCPECGEPIPQLSDDDYEHDFPSDGSR